MRLARVLIADAPTPQVALERDGCLYDVETLEERWGTRFSPERFANAGDFHTRVVALDGAGLDELDRRLCSGERPTEARLATDGFVWCPPFAADRAMFVELQGAGDDGEPRYRIGNARAISGHGATLVFPSFEERPEVRLDVAVMLREDLVHATPAETLTAIAGVAVLAAWTGLDERDRARAASRGDGASRDRATQLGPVLVTLDELGPLAGKRARVRLGDRILERTISSSLEEIAASVAALSQVLDLCAGDLVGAGLDLARLVVPAGASIDLAIDGLGRLGGRPVKRP